MIPPRLCSRIPREKSTRMFIIFSTVPIIVNRYHIDPKYNVNLCSILVYKMSLYLGKSRCNDDMIPKTKRIHHDVMSS